MAGEIEMMNAETENSKEIDKQMNSSEIQNQISLEADQKSDKQPITNQSTCETMEGEIEYVVGDNTGEGDGDEEGEDDEEIITSAMPPTQIVDTIVTTTTNPDGSLKRTTRKTTRTVLTTARIRKIKVKNLPSDGESSKSSSTSTNNDLNMSNVINFTKLNSEKSEGKSLAQATLAIIPPQTEVTYQENVKPISDIDADTAAKLQQSTSNENSSDNVTPQKAITKTTMKKTVSATAATATFYATGKDAMSPRLFTTTGATNEMLFNSCNSSPLLSTNDGNKGLTKSTIKIAAFKRTSNTSPTKRKARDSLTTSASTTTTTTTTTLGASSTTTTTTTRKQTTRVMNNFASKGFFFTFKKPFGLFGREIRGDIEDNQNNASIGSNNTDIVDTEQLALLTMKESERLFSQAKLMFPSNQNLSSDVTIQSSSSGKNEDGVVQGYQSRFANLPLYQGYGIIAHQMALSNKVKTTKTSDADSGVQHQDDEEDKKKSVDVISDAVDIKQQVTDQTGADMNLVANAFAHLLDESILKFLCEATSQQLGRSGPLNLFELPAYIEGLPQNKQLVYSGSTDEGIAQPGDNFNKSLALPSTEQFDDKTDEKIKESEQNRPQQLTDSTGTQIGQTLGQKTSRFGGGSQGAFRVAWSEMPEVVESNCLQRLTRHEIQLQEAMFEVITSEASYYQSLNVLVNHFYHAPEFECEPLNHTSSFQSNQAPSKVCKEPGSPLPGQPDLANNQTTVDMNTAPTNATTTTTGNGTTTNNNSNNVSSATTPPCTTTTTTTTATSNNVGSTDSCVDAGNQTPASSNTRRPLLKPLEKHHLFSNVLLVCLASEMFLRDLEARWEARMPILNEVCDLIVKHAGGVNFEPYITYLRNQTYQMDTLRTLCQRESFREALERLHSHPRSGKNLITSFLALPMQRLTRLKLLVEVIRRLQDAVIRDSMDKTLEKRPFRVPSDRERENVQLALRELNRLLTASETEKELMDRKSRLLTLSSSLEFPDNVKVSVYFQLLYM
ncbi:unnamed protein product [Trichobilharzia szidati]|nr:unnamed protein product [Trichobilharzia szidati]